MVIESHLPSHVAPIQTLPNELLVEVFKAGASKPNASVNCCDTPFPCVVSSVNRHWREVALSSPDIWTNIVISDSQPLTLPALCMKRSSDKPLHGFISISELHSCDYHAISLLLRFKNIRRLTMTINVSSTWSRHHFFQFRHIIKTCSVQLESIECTFMENSSVINPQSDLIIVALLSAFEDVRQPRLGSLKLNGVGIFDCSSLTALAPSMTVQIPSLTNIYLKFDPGYFSFAGENWVALKAFLSYCERLEELIMDGVHLPLPSDISSENIISLPSLRSLALCWPHEATSYNFKKLIHCIEAPSLTYLELVGVHGNDLNTLARSSHLPLYPKLRVLRLGCSAQHLEALCPEFYEFFSSVQDLQLARSDHYYFLSDVPPSAGGEGQFSCWPALAILSYDGNDFDWLHGIVRSRASLGCPLQHVRLMRNHFQRAQIEQLKEWVTLESMAERDSGLLSISPVADLGDVLDAEGVWNWVEM